MAGYIQAYRGRKYDIRNHLCTVTMLDDVNFRSLVQDPVSDGHEFSVHYLLNVPRDGET